MTPQRAAAVLAALLEVAPVELAKGDLQRNRCIRATVIGREVLHYFGLMGAPVALQVTVWNRVAEGWRQEGMPGGPEEGRRRGAYMLCVDVKTPAPGKFAGHLALFLPELRGLLDLDLQQFSRPERGLRLPGAGFFEDFDSTGPDEGCVYTEGPDEAYIAYALLPHKQEYRTARDFRAWARFKPVIGRIIRQVRARLEVP